MENEIPLYRSRKYKYCEIKNAGLEVKKIFKTVLKVHYLGKEVRTSIDDKCFGYISV